MNTARREVLRGGKPVAIEPKVFDLLLYLLENRGRVVSRDDLLEAVWNGRIVSDASLSSCIRSARAAVGDDGKRQGVIKTLNGRGFRFVADLADAPSALRSDPLPDASPTAPSLAVLPFTNLCDTPGQNYLVDGICEDIIAALLRIRWLFLIARNSSFSYRGTETGLPEIGRDLGVRYLLQGSVQKAGQRIRITAKLVEAQTGAHIWTERYDRDFVDVFALQDEITAQIVGALEPQVSFAEQARVHRKPEQNLDAWDLVIRALAESSKFTNAASAEALRLLDRALEIDPSYARALGQKAWLSIWRVHQGWEAAETALPRAIAAAEQAVRFDPEEPWAYDAWGFIGSVQKDIDLMRSSVEQILEINPNLAIAHSFQGAFLAVTGRGDQSMPHIERARRLSPRDILREEFDVHASFAYFQIADYDHAAEYALKASLPRPDHVYPRLILAASHGHLGNETAAQAQAARIRDLVPGFSLAQARSVCVYALEPDIDRFIEGLEKAGLR